MRRWGGGEKEVYEEEMEDGREVGGGIGGSRRIWLRCN